MSVYTTALNRAKNQKADEELHLLSVANEIKKLEGEIAMRKRQEETAKGEIHRLARLIESLEVAARDEGQ